MLNLVQHIAVNISEILNSYFTQSATTALVQLRFQNDGNYWMAEGLLEVDNFNIHISGRHSARSLVMVVVKPRRSC